VRSPVLCYIVFNWGYGNFFHYPAAKKHCCRVFSAATQRPFRMADGTGHPVLEAIYGEAALH